MIDFGAMIKIVLRHWWWYVIAVVLCVGAAWLYMRVKTPKYYVQSLVMLNQDDDSGSSGAIGGGLGALMSSFSIGGSGANIEDELLKMHSHTNMMKVVRTLKLNRTYWGKTSMLKPKTLFYNNAPLTIDVPDEVLDTIGASTLFKISMRGPGKKMRLTVDQGKDKGIIDTEIPSLPYNVRTPRGMFRISATAAYNPEEEMTLYALMQNPANSAAWLSSEIGIEKYGKKTNGIFLNIEDGLPERGVDILNTTVSVFNNLSTEMKHANAQATADFLNGRLVDMYNQLEGTEKKIEVYKRDNQITDATAEAQYIFTKKGTVEAQLLELQTKLEVLKMVQDFLHEPANKYKLIPFAADLPEKPIEAYNELVLMRIKLDGNSRPDNATLKKLSGQIDAMRDNLLTTLDRQMASTKIAINDMKREENSSASRMSGIPEMERELLALYRDQTVKSQIYGFLLQKREENEMKLARTAPTAQVLDAAYADTEPTGPGKMMVYLVAFFIGLLIPSAILFVRKH